MKYYNVSYLYIEEFFKIYNVDYVRFIHNKYSKKRIMSLYMDFIYFHILRNLDEYLLIIEPFAYLYKRYVLIWPSDLDKFLNIVNELNIVEINKGINRIRYDLGHIGEFKILDAILNFIINNRRFIISRYNLK